MFVCFVFVSSGMKLIYLKHLVLLYSSFFDIEVAIYLVTKQGTLMRRSIVLSLPHQLVFPAERFANDFEGQNIMMIEETKFLRHCRQSLIKLDQFIDKKY